MMAFPTLSVPVILFSIDTVYSLSFKIVPSLFYYFIQSGLFQPGWKHCNNFSQEHEYLTRTVYEEATKE